jgi:hypothetical protein
LILRPPLSLVLLAPSFHLSGTITFPSFFSPAATNPANLSYSAYQEKEIQIPARRNPRPKRDGGRILGQGPSSADGTTEGESSYTWRTPSPPPVVPFLGLANRFGAGVGDDTGEKGRRRREGGAGDSVSRAESGPTCQCLTATSGDPPPGPGRVRQTVSIRTFKKNSINKKEHGDLKNSIMSPFQPTKLGSLILPKDNMVGCYWAPADFQIIFGLNCLVKFTALKKY